MTLSLIRLVSSLLKKPLAVMHSFDHAASQIQAGRMPDLIISDIRDDVGGGAHFIRQISASHPKVCHIAVTDGSDDSATVEALLAGAHDVVGYPFSLRELALRIRLRLGRQDDESFDIHDGAYFDWDAIEFVAELAHLTSVETQIAGLLFGKNGEIVSRNELSFAVDHRPWTYGDRKFDVHVAKIRKKLHSSFGSRIEVRTIRSAGYQLIVTDSTLMTGPSYP